MSARGKSGVYAAAQTLLVCVFAGVYFVDREPPLWMRGGVSSAAGAGLCVIGLLLMLSAVVTLRRVIQIAPEPRSNGELVTTGTYGRFRHPIYTGILMLVVGLFLRKSTALVGISAAAVIAFLALKVRLEEELLLARYPEYATYRARTWGLTPWSTRSRRM